MKKSLSMLTILLFFSSVLLALEIDQIEYFFDADPGMGFVTPLTSRNTVDYYQILNASSLSPGIHRLYIRARTSDGNWGIPYCKNIFVPTQLDAGGTLANINNIEYFFDTDPGFGAGTQVFSRNTVDTNAIINATSLTTGVHKLYIRAKNDNGDWGLPRVKSIYIPAQMDAGESAANINNFEYFFDTDPGLGNATQIISRNTVSTDAILNASTLTAGTHRLYIRGINAAGNWGMPIKRTIFVPYHLESGGTAANITNLEYFFDTDPGLGSATQIVSRNTVDTDAIINASTLTKGIHKLYLRARNQAGQWGIPKTKVIFVPNTLDAGGTVANVTNVEYFFDTDPGLGSATQIVTRNTVDINTIINASTLTKGIHRLYLRARNQAGQWGIPKTKVIFVPNNLDAGGTAANVTNVEYFFDTDPGFGNGTQIISRNTVDYNAIINASALSAGMHKLYVRAKNSSNVWGMPKGKMVCVISNALGGQNANIVAMEYFIDTDPGFGMGTPVLLSPAQSFNISITAQTGIVSSGEHILYIRAKNSNNVWGIPASQEFSNGIPGNITIQISEGTLTLSWDLVKGASTYNVYSSENNSDFALDYSGSLLGTSWTTSILTSTAKFFKVTSVIDEPGRSSLIRSSKETNNR